MTSRFRTPRPPIAWIASLLTFLVVFGAETSQYAAAQDWSEPADLESTGAVLAELPPNLDLPVDERLNDPRLPSPPYLQRFRKLTEGLYRGSQPTSADIAFLKDQGIRTIISFVSSPRDILEWEQEEAAVLGLKFFSFPISSFMGPSEEKTEAIFGEILRSSQQPIYFHCKHGKDRTGFIAGLYRVHFQGWTPELAYAEAKALGFNPWLLGLHAKFKRYMAHAPWEITPANGDLLNLFAPPTALMP